jgi:hypothetical protein
MQLFTAICVKECCREFQKVFLAANCGTKNNESQCHNKIVFCRIDAVRKEISSTRVLNEEMLDNSDTLLEASPKQLALQCWLPKSRSRRYEVAKVTAM